jgi:predicted chitinase
MVTRYENEWQFKQEKWDSLDELMGHSESEPHNEWIEEKARIKKLSWWDKLVGQHGITSDTNVRHFHPIALIGSFTAPRDLITMEMLRAANPTGSEAHHSNILPYLNKYAAAYKLEQPRAIAHFLSQVGHESQLRIIEEGLNYSARQMKKTYGCKWHNKVNGYNEQTDSCDFGVLRSKLWSETSHYAMNAENLASYVYADRMGNGNEASRDGYRYRGRGMLQVTGKSEYQRFTNVHNQRNPTDIQDFVANPDLLISSTEYGVESAFVFWFTKAGQGGTKLCEVAKTGSVVDVTQMVNGGQNGYADRNSRFQALAALMNIN